jgi:hypothetical protein
VVFTPAQAEDFAQKLSALQLDKDDVTQYVIEFCGAAGPETMVSGVLDAAKLLPATLESVKHGTIGLMSIG